MSGKHTIYQWLMVAGAFFGVAATQALAAEVEAKKDGVEIYAEASNKSAVVGTLKKGEGVPSVERKGMYWEIKLTDGKTGFVSVLSVKHKADEGGDLANAVKSVVKQGRSTDEASDSRARSAVMGVRGLKQDENVANAGNVKPNLRAVYSMEDRLVANKSVEALGDLVFNEIAKKSREK